MMCVKIFVWEMCKYPPELFHTNYTPLRARIKWFWFFKNTVTDKTRIDLTESDHWQTVALYTKCSIFNSVHTTSSNIKGEKSTIHLKCFENDFIIYILLFFPGNTWCCLFLKNKPENTFYMTNFKYLSTEHTLLLFLFLGRLNISVTTFCRGFICRKL